LNSALHRMVRRVGHAHHSRLNKSRCCARRSLLRHHGRLDRTSWVNRRATLNGDLPDVRPSASVTRQVLRIRSQKPKRHAALSRRRNQCRPPIGDVRPHSPLIVEGLSTEISLKTVFIRDARGRMDLALASIPFKLPAPRPDDRLVEPAQSGSSIGAMGGTRKGSSGPASHRNAPGQSTPGAYPCTGTCKRSSTLDPPHDRPEHRSCTDARTRS